jgi:hypothetical protein
MTRPIRMRPLSEIKLESSKATPQSLVKTKEETEDQAIARIEAKYLQRATTPLRAIRAKCVQCQGGQVKQVAKCEATSCALHPFRMEHNPYHSAAKPAATPVAGPARRVRVR